MVSNFLTVCRNMIDFCMLTLYPMTWLKSLNWCFVDRFLGIFYIDKNVCKYEFTLECTVSLDTFFNMTKKMVSNMLLYWFEDLQSIIFRNNISTTFWWLSTQTYWLRAFYLVNVLNSFWIFIHHLFLSSTQQQILTESLWFSIGPEFLPFLFGP